MHRLGRRLALLALIVAALHPLANATEDPAAVVEAFHGALAAGNRVEALALLGPDAVVIEGGDLETRAEYAAHHLDADIAFAKAVRSKRSKPVVTVEGAAAWVHSTSATRGEFDGRPVDIVGAELMVLTRTAQGWRIRAIHWSSRKASRPVQQPRSQ